MTVRFLLFAFAHYSFDLISILMMEVLARLQYTEMISMGPIWTIVKFLSYAIRKA